MVLEHIPFGLFGTGICAGLLCPGDTSRARHVHGRVKLYGSSVCDRSQDDGILAPHSVERPWMARRHAIWRQGVEVARWVPVTSIARSGVAARGPDPRYPHAPKPPRPTRLPAASAALAPAAEPATSPAGRRCRPPHARSGLPPQLTNLTNLSFLQARGQCMCSKARMRRYAHALRARWFLPAHRENTSRRLATTGAS